MPRKYKLLYSVVKMDASGIRLCGFCRWIRCVRLIFFGKQFVELCHEFFAARDHVFGRFPVIIAWWIRVCHGQRFSGSNGQIKNEPG